MRKIIITKKNSGGRIDKFLKMEFFLNDNITRGEIIKQIKAGKVLANNKIIKPSYILKEQDEIKIDIKKEKNILKPSRKIKLKIIFQDENIIAIDKPAGMQVHPDDNQKENTLVNYLLAEFPEIENIYDDSEDDRMRPGIVHRLDKDTSGVIIIARNQKTFLELKRQFKNKEIEKKYLAIVYGMPNLNEGVIEKPLARSTDYRKQTVAGRKTKTKIREAITYYKTIKVLKDNFVLLEVAPKTGRMHQIRVHLTSDGHPIVGDKKYFLKNIKRLAKIDRQLLHATSIKFSLFGKAYEFNSPLPKDFEEFMKTHFLD
ncbi:MAG TPA: RluA family pseudouridine synthase [Candidatus Moranbacteria bacterium]|nr:RluA family pseudouridine synthase [Candidatus Moranbacteria bacterium]HAT74768.1 RluA family pseudouridine synthase [Candidatus Moranbacteria bacterium]